MAALLRGFIQQYGGRKRYCRACGKIWHLNLVGHRIVVGVALALLVTGAALPYVVCDTIPRADQWCVTWLVLAPTVGWPVVFHLWWKLKVRR